MGRSRSRRHLRLGQEHLRALGEVSVNTSLENFGDSYAIKGTAGLCNKW